ncbi:DUF1850 domain-containing protein [Oceanithermus sp.]
MRRAPAFLLTVGALLFFLWLFWPRPFLLVDIDGYGQLRFPVSEGQRVELTWIHSVSAIPVQEVFRVRDGELVLMETHNQWFAAGLGEIAGRGRTVAEKNHAVAIVDINEPADGMILRIGSPQIHHTLITGRVRCDLSALAPHKRARFEVVVMPRVWGWFGARCHAGRQT